MNVDTGRFMSLPEMEKQVEEGTPREKFKLFTVGESITVEGEPFIIQAVVDDCLILVSQKKAELLQAKR